MNWMRPSLVKQLPQHHVVLGFVEVLVAAVGLCYGLCALARTAMLSSRETKLAATDC